MQSIDLYIQANVLMAWLVLIVSFVVLFKCAELFVDNSVALAKRLKVPKLVIGIVLVSLATTAPELSVSLIAALRGSPEMALGNAIGSVICDDGLALALAGVVTLSPIAVIPSVLKSSGIFLIIISILTFSFVAFDNTLNRYEGVILVILFACYMTYLYRQHKNSKPEDETGDIEKTSPVKLFAMFALALGGIILASEFVITSATAIARSFNVSEGVIALTMVAFGTSVPEVATCITASRKGEGSIAVGNILGADKIGRAHV